MTIKIKDILKRLFFTNRQSEDKYKGEIRQVSIKDIHEAKKSLEEVGGIEFGTNKSKKKSAEEKEEDTLQERHRYELIAAMHEGIAYFNNNDERKKVSIESLARSKMTIEEIKWHLDLVRDFVNNNNTSRIGGSSIQTKLPQKSTPDHIR